MRAVHLPLCVLLAAAPGCARTTADRVLAEVDDTNDIDDDDDAANTGDLVAEAERRGALPEESARPAQITGVFIDDGLATTCGISFPSEPFFEYDSAANEPDDNPLLRRLADCLVTGTLAGRTIGLHGYTGADDDREYSDLVGMSRAEAVRSFLITQGVAPSAIDVQPGDETGVLPEEPSAWPFERRVDIVLLPVE